jgi:YidC/Oxa1 family membrane protein insertase
MMEIQPLIQELKAEYGDDQAGFATAQMELMRKNNINPFAGCGPLLIQLPFLYAITYSIYNGLTANNPHLYSWVPRAAMLALYSSVSTCSSQTTPLFCQSWQLFCSISLCGW